MKTQVHTMWCFISGEAAGEIWNWSLLGMRGLIVRDRTEVYLATQLISNFAYVHFQWSFLLESLLEKLRGESPDDHESMKTRTGLLGLVKGWSSKTNTFVHISYFHSMTDLYIAPSVRYQFLHSFTYLFVVFSFIQFCSVLVFCYPFPHTTHSHVSSVFRLLFLFPIPLSLIHFFVRSFVRPVVYRPFSRPSVIHLFARSSVSSYVRSFTSVPVFNHPFAHQLTRRLRRLQMSYPTWRWSRLPWNCCLFFPPTVRSRFSCPSWNSPTSTPHPRTSLSSSPLLANDVGTWSRLLLWGDGMGVALGD